MANNRMWLVCRVCGNKILLGKHNGEGYYSFHDKKEMDSFYDEHAFCYGNEEKAEELNYENYFELAYDHAHDDGVKEI